jgi:hypothetical protein
MYGASQFKTQQRCNRCKIVLCSVKTTLPQILTCSQGSDATDHILQAAVQHYANNDVSFYAEVAQPGGQLLSQTVQLAVAHL